MAITLRGTVTDRIPINGGGTHDVSLPGGTAEDDVVAAAESCDFGSIGISTSGYTQLWQNVSSGNSGFAYKVMGATPDSVVAWNKTTNNIMPVCVQVWTGVDTATPIDATAQTATGSTGMPDPPSYTTVTNSARRIIVGGLDDDEEAGSASAPSGFADLTVIDTNLGSGIRSTTMMASKDEATAGTLDPDAFGGSGTDAWGAGHLAFRPAGAAAAAIGPGRGLTRSILLQPRGLVA